MADGAEDEPKEPSLTERVTHIRYLDGQRRQWGFHPELRDRTQADYNAYRDADREAAAVYDEEVARRQGLAEDLAARLINQATNNGTPTN